MQTLNRTTSCTHHTDKDGLMFQVLLAHLSVFQVPYYTCSVTFEAVAEDVL